MNFKLTEEQEMLRNSARSFLKTECPKSLLRELEDSDSGHSPELWRKMAQLGWMGIHVPEAYGGVGGTLLDLGVLFEEFGRAALPGPMFPTILGTLILLEGGTEEQKKTLLPEAVSGNLILTVALEEPETAYDPRFVAVRATPGDREHVISGTKLFVPYPHVAGRLLTVTRTAGDPGSEQGISVFLVDGKSAGLTLTPIKTIAADRQFQVDFNSVAVSPDDVIGGLDAGLSPVRAALEKATGIQCAEIVGGAQQQLEMTAEHTKTRVQFGRAIGTFQAVQHRLADMYIDVNGARWAAYQAVWRLSEGMPVARELAMAKFFVGRASQRVAFSAQQLHGGVGVDMDYDLHFYFRKAKARELTLGSPAYHLAALGAKI